MQKTVRTSPNNMRFPTVVMVITGACVLLGGCGSFGRQAPANLPAARAGSGATTEGSTPEKGSTTGSVTPTGLSTASIPSELKGLAYEYYGLESVKTAMKTTTPPTLSGFVEYSLDKATPTEAVFRVNYTGDLQTQLSSGKVSVRKDGIYNTELSGNPIEPPALDLPNDLTPGKTWHVKFKVKSGDGRVVSQDTNDKVIGPGKVKVEGETFDAIQVQENGFFYLDDKKSAVIANKWFVKGRGVVKQTIFLTGSDKQKKTMEIISTKAVEPAAQAPATTTGTGAGK